jgi:hypothetical protein
MPNKQPSFAERCRAIHDSAVQLKGVSQCAWKMNALVRIGPEADEVSSGLKRCKPKQAALGGAPMLMMRRYFICGVPGVATRTR